MAQSTVTEEITSLLEENKTSAEIIGKGYRPGTVYGVQRKWRKGRASYNSPDTQVAVEPVAESSIAAANQELELEERIGVLGDYERLEAGLRCIEAMAMNHGQYKYNCCLHAYGEKCDYHEWRGRNEIQEGAGEASVFGEAARSHWGIENSVHWILDIALNLLKQEKTAKCGIKARRKKAG